MKSFQEFAEERGMTEEQLRAKLIEELPAFLAYLATIHVPDNLPEVRFTPS